MIKYIKGDLFSTDAPAILHGVNCQGVMASGVAKTFKEIYPSSYMKYLAYHQKGRESKSFFNPIGKIVWMKEWDDKITISGHTQNFYGKDGKLYTNYGAVTEVMLYCNLLCLELGINQIAMPKIGCGLGGGDWNVVSNLINDSANFEALVYEL